MNETLTLGSLFDGSGGFPLGGLLHGITPLWASEIEPFPIRVTTKRLPNMKHYGDVSRLCGAELSPVDIITFGSPCQDMSIAGKRAGLDGERSGLFYEAVRIVKEMRCKTDGKYPRFVVWENVQGAFSSNKGEDFRCVLEALSQVKDSAATIPKPQNGKWNGSGSVVGDGYSIAWRTLDAQYWGVPQRRKRIYLVADFRGECAGKILFESEGLSGHSAESFRAWQRTTSGTPKSTRGTGGLCLNDQGGARMDVTKEKTSTLRAESHHPPCVMERVAIENHGTDSRVKISEDGVVQTLTSRMGTGGNNVPLVAEGKACFDVRFTSEGTKNARHNCYKTDTARTIDTSGNAPDSNQGGVAVVAVQGSMIGRTEKNGPQESGTGENISFTLNTTDRHAVAFSQDVYDKYTENPCAGALRASGGMYGGGSESLVYSTSKNSYHTEVEKNIVSTLVATDFKDPPTVTKAPQYIVRRLTPRECARLQGFPDWWCDDLGTENPTEEELAFWREVFETHRLVMDASRKPKSDKQIIKWLKEPYSDSAAYKMWGNGVALPCVSFVLAGIVWIVKNKSTN